MQSIASLAPQDDVSLSGVLAMQQALGRNAA